MPGSTKTRKDIEIPPYEKKAIAAVSSCKGVKTVLL